MVFSSAIFLLCFLPIVILVYYNPLIKGRKFKNVFLVLTSLGFYAWGEPIFVLLMLLSILVNWKLGQWLERKNYSKKILWVGVIYNLLLLFGFKYLGFVCHNLGILFQKDLEVNIALPIGISFFTFQMMSYLFDIYYGKAKVQNSVINVGLYVSFFPQLIAGPIVRYETIAEEIENRKENWNEITEGICRFIYGLSKKVILSNTLARAADTCFAEVEQMAAASLWIGAIAYTLQIYFDFSGYSDMAIGLGKMFGFHFPENFNYPYISKSVTEFWRRWHITLSTWFRDYLYIPLGGNRVSKGRWIFNLFMVWLCTGIWHGANWTFIVWGLAYFVVLILEKLFLKNEKVKGNEEGILKKIVEHGYTMLIVIVLWVIFRADSMKQAMMYIGNMFAVFSDNWWDSQTTELLANYGIGIIAAAFAATPLYKVVIERVKIHETIKEVAYCIWTILLFVVSLCLIVNNSYNPFIYFNF